MPQDQALHKAAHKGELPLVEELLDRNEDINAKGACDRTPLHKAVGAGEKGLQVVKLLLERGANVNLTDSGGLTPLHWAALMGFVEPAKELLARNADINCRTKNMETPLYLAAEKGKLEMVQFLLSQNADATLTDKQDPGATPWDVAKKNGHKEVCQVLRPSSACCVVL